MNIADKLLQLNTNLDTINVEVNAQEGLIGQIITKINSLPAQLDTSDANATADKIVENYSAYVNGEKIEGSIKTLYGGLNEYGAVVDKSYMGAIGVNYTVTEPSYISPTTGPDISLTASLSDFGDATAEDVVAGKTFTSSAGLKVTGTATLGGSSEDLEALGVLCDWQLMTDSYSFPIVTIINYHPSYYLHCDIIFDGEMVPFVVSPAPDADGTASSYSWADYGLPFSDTGNIDVIDVRWKANA